LPVAKLVATVRPWSAELGGEVVVCARETYSSAMQLVTAGTS
jgi:hypothetical protein